MGACVSCPFGWLSPCPGFLKRLSSSPPWAGLVQCLDTTPCLAQDWPGCPGCGGLGIQAIHSLDSWTARAASQLGPHFLSHRPHL